MKQQEAKFGEWVLPEEVQLESNVNVDQGSDPICSSAGCTQFKHPKKKEAYPINYPVVDNGIDREMLTTENSLKIAEGIVGHHWDFKFKPKPVNPAKKVLYDDAPVLDSNIVDSLSNLNKTETVKSHKLNLDVAADVQLEEQSLSDPICSSAGCVQFKHPKKKDPYPINYPVPNFGVDRDIIDNQDDLKVAEGIVGHHWDFKF